MQCINKFNGAKRQYLTMAYALYLNNKSPFVAVISTTVIVLIQTHIHALLSFLHLNFGYHKTLEPE